jgi:CheY-like chemotaxis protein
MSCFSTSLKIVSSPLCSVNSSLPTSPAQDILPAYGCRQVKRVKGRLPLHTHRAFTLLRRVPSLIAKCRERVVKSRVLSVNAHKWRMREACYARCGDRQGRPNKTDTRAAWRNERDTEAEDHRAGHLAYDAQDPRDHPLEALHARSRQGTAGLLFLGLDLPKMDGYEVLKYLRAEPRLHPMDHAALLNVREGILVRLNARLPGAQHVVRKPLIRQRIIALMSEYVCRSASAQDIEVASCPERNEPDGTDGSGIL